MMGGAFILEVRTYMCAAGSVYTVKTLASGDDERLETVSRARLKAAASRVTVGQVDCMDVPTDAAQTSI